MATQIKLLRVLENSEITRVGSNEAIQVNVRILSATNRNLEDSIAAGTFRSDLYHRLKVVTIDLPRLAERSQDIPLLIEHFMKQFAKRHHKTIKSMSAAARRRLMAYDWPGNVRQLRNVIESMVVVDYDGVLDVDDLPERIVPRRRRRPRKPRGGSLAGAGRQAAVGDRAAVHRRNLATDRRQSRSRRRAAGHRPANAVSQDQGISICRHAARCEHCARPLQREIAFMNDIRQLPPSVVNKIAAGEVIERPASVVKELMENSIDAGATRIDVAVEQGGLELVRVSDDGCGIAADELPLAVASHATSKIADADDLFRVAHAGLSRRGAGLDRRSQPPDAAQPHARRPTPAAELEVAGGHATAGRPLRLPGRHDRRGPATVLQHAGAAQVPAHHADRDGTRQRGLHAHGAGQSARPLHAARTTTASLYDLPPADDWRERIAAFFGHDLAADLIAVSQRRRRRAAGRLRRQPQPQPRQPALAVPVSQRPRHPRPLAAARLERGLSRAAADRPLSDRVSADRHAGRTWST